MATQPEGEGGEEGVVPSASAALASASAVAAATTWETPQAERPPLWPSQPRHQLPTASAEPDEKLTGARVGSSRDRLSRRNCRKPESFQNVLHPV